MSLRRLLCASLVSLALMPRLGLALEVTGTVTNEVGSPLQGVMVELRWATGLGWLLGDTQVTAADGSYVIETEQPSISVGARLIAESPGRVGRAWPEEDCVVECRFGAIGGANVVLDGRPHDFVLPPANTISGILSDPQNSAMSNQPVSLFDESGVRVSMVTTDALGMYSFSPLGMGKFYLLAGDGQEFLRVLYPNQPCMLDCDVTQGDVLSLNQYDLTLGSTNLTAIVGARIGGLVRSSDDGSVPHQIDYSDRACNVHVFDFMGELVEQSPGCDEFGVYQTGPLIAGDYRLALSDVRWGTHAPEVYDDIDCPQSGCSSVSGTIVSLSQGQQLSDISFSPDRRSRITGRVTDTLTGGPLPAKVNMSSFVESSFPMPSSGWNLLHHEENVDSMGNYVVYAVSPSAEHKPNLTPPIGYFDAYVAASGASVSCAFECDRSLGVSFDPDFKQEIPGIDIALERSGWIGGSVADSLGAPVEATVVLHDELGNELIRASTDSATGDFTINALPTANYRVLAFRDGIVAVYPDILCKFGECDALDGGLIGVEQPNETPGIDLRLPRSLEVFSDGFE